MLSPAALPDNQGQPQPGPVTRSVEGDVKRLADIRASLQDIQRRKSAPGAANLSFKSSGRIKSQSGPFTPPHRLGENANPLLQSTPYLAINRPQPFTQRDMNRDIKVFLKAYSCSACHKPLDTCSTVVHLAPQLLAFWHKVTLSASSASAK